ncbi:uncharacterized protein B0H18DRAFT_970186 [Fomitopsis serialis]|uniref:uncharacterized protein n=1 Tax=Fomitopsis serialis TaxID=139415 RepID=UPI002007BEFC|nr:uncharacterized protein B0H18DRAFT_970186 [Neoantrodia serialis]KAH9937351.1 hypothetical protein B0H18DRAFT_970186 [Neoantrodia serialis]
MVAALESLPSELYIAILSHISPRDLQHTHVRLTHGNQVIRLYTRLRKSPEDADRVRHLSLECWTVDADVVVNLIALLHRMREMSLLIGPNFAPEHLEEMFQKPKHGLRFISLRFRPYVQRATYYQFLKGAYFDTTLLAFSRWPAEDLPTLSIVQDPLEPSIAPTKFAQPLVFFRLDPLSTLACSPFLEGLRHFRLRVPARQAARFLYALPNALPRVELLDMSTCNVLESDVEGMLGRFGRLRSLVLDGCYIVSQRAVADGQDPEEALGHWAALGKMMALAGAKYAREREKRLKLWIEAVRARAAAAQVGEGVVQEQAPAPPRARRGRRGLATATISLRDSPPKDPVVLPKLPAGAPPGAPPPNQRIRILPSLPALRSLATTPPASVGPDKHDTIRAEFARGWGRASRSCTSWGNGVRIVRFDPDYEADEEDGDGEDGLAGLMDVEDERAFVIKTKAVDGSGEDKAEMLGVDDGREGHMEGCGHQLGWDVWHDEL